MVIDFANAYCLCIEPSPTTSVESEVTREASAWLDDSLESSVTGDTTSDIDDCHPGILDQEHNTVPSFSSVATKDPSGYYTTGSSKQSNDVKFSYEGRKRNQCSGNTAVPHWTSLKSKSSIIHRDTTITVGEALEFNLVDQFGRPLIAYARVLHIKAFGEPDGEHSHLLHILYYFTREEAFAEKIPNLLERWPDTSPCFLMLSTHTQIVSVKGVRGNLDPEKRILEGEILNCTTQAIKVEDDSGSLFLSQKITACNKRSANFGTWLTTQFMSGIKSCSLSPFFAYVE